MTNTKALVLAAGRGSRLENLTDDKNKCMNEFRGRPLIEYSLENAIRAQISEIVIVVGYKAQSIIDRLGKDFKGTPIKYVLQRERKGLVEAIECSQDAIDGSDFMLFLADEIFIGARHSEMISHFNSQGLFAICGVVQVEDISEISKTYALIFNELNNRIYRLIEKPRKPLNNLMGTGNCVFKNEVFNYIPYVPINHQRGEKELPDLMQCAIDDGLLVEYFDIGHRYININTLDDLRRVEILDKEVPELDRRY